MNKRFTITWLGIHNDERMQTCVNGIQELIEEIELLSGNDIVSIVNEEFKVTKHNVNAGDAFIAGIRFPQPRF